MCRWTTRGHERLSLPGAKSRLEHFADRPVYDAAIRAGLADFLAFGRVARARRFALAHGIAAHRVIDLRAVGRRRRGTEAIAVGADG